MTKPPTVTVGVVSDTHGLVRPQALEALAGVDLIVHAGDVGGPEVLEALGAIAPVHAIRGNVDVGSPWAEGLPDTRVVEVGEVRLYLIHDVKALEIDPAAEGVDVVVCGHSHQPRMETEDGVLYFNPGSCGPRRFSLPIVLGRLTVTGRDVAGAHRYLE